MPGIGRQWIPIHWTTREVLTFGKRAFAGSRLSWCPYKEREMKTWRKQEEGHVMTEMEM